MTPETRPVHIEPFAVEQWMNAWETRCRLNLAETCVDSLTIAGLLALCGRNRADLADLLDVTMTYGAIEGSDRLRDGICGLYDRQQRDNIVVTHGTIGANMLVYRALVSPGDRVVSIVPTYQQHVAIPESLGAQVHKVALRPENGYLPDMSELAAAVTPGTRMISIANPNNPTGALMPGSMLNDLAAIARKAGAWILGDEVYRGTDQNDPGVTASIADIYDRGISTAGMSKAFSLAGLRLGWIAGPPDLLRDVAIHRDYDTISVGILDDHLAALALEHRAAILARSRQITRTNRALLDDWLAGQPRLGWVRPASGTTALIRYELDLGSEDLCRRLLRQTGVLLTPGAALGMEGQVRIGYGCATETLRAGLAALADFVAAAPAPNHG